MNVNFNKYDSVFLNDKEFIIIDIININSKFYFLLSSSKENDELDFSNLKIVEYSSDDDSNNIKEVVDEKLYLELSRKFIINLENV